MPTSSPDNTWSKGRHAWGRGRKKSVSWSLETQQQMGIGLMVKKRKIGPGQDIIFILNWLGPLIEPPWEESAVSLGGIMAKVSIWGGRTIGSRLSNEQGTDNFNKYLFSLWVFPPPPGKWTFSPINRMKAERFNLEKFTFRTAFIPHLESYYASLQFLFLFCMDSSLHSIYKSHASFFLLCVAAY